MFRNLFAVFATLMVSAGAASASTPTTDTTSLSLEQRVQAAQKTIGQLMNADEQQASKSITDKVAQYWNNWHNYYYRPWNNWNNWHNYYGGY
jgi:hypothetical protein